MSENHVRMQVSALSVDPISNLPVVLLDQIAVSDPEQPRYLLSVSIGLGEAAAIAAELDCIEFERPTTHRLIAAICTCGDIALERIEFYDVHGGRFCVRIWLCLRDGEMIAQESRPSDALVLALLQGAEIWVAKQVLDSVGRCDLSADAWALAATGISDVDFADLGVLGEPGEVSDTGDDIVGKWKM